MFQISSGNKHIQKGFVFLEIIIGVSLISVAFMTLLGMGFSALNLSSSIKVSMRADALIREELEIARTYRDGTDWSVDGLGTVFDGMDYYFSLDQSANPDAWVLTTGTETVGEFTRKVVFAMGLRDGNGNLLSPGSCQGFCSGTWDTDTKLLTVTLVHVPTNKTFTVMSYLMNWRE